MGAAPHDDADMSHQARVARYGHVATALALLSDHRLSRLVAAAQPVGSGIGGTSALLDVGDIPVFVKRVPLTDVERDPQHVMSTANLFGLPAFCHYGVGSPGSPGFGAWRELAANTMTTNWVLTGQVEAFPLMYHWRLLPGAAPLADEHADIEQVVAYWGGSPAVRQRLHALAEASASLVLFLEYIPLNLRDWLAQQLAAGHDSITDACELVERCLRADVAFMNAHGLLHFDAHFGNILTDGRRLYLADLGLVTSTRFDLAPVERDFITQNLSHDACHTMTELVNWLVTHVAAVADPATGGPVERNAYIRRCAAGASPQGVPAPIATLISRYAPAVTIINEFYWSLFGESRATPYPQHEITQAIAAIPGFASALPCPPSQWPGDHALR